MQPDGGRVVVVGKLDAVPEAAGGRALRIVVCSAQVTVLRPDARPARATGGWSGDGPVTRRRGYGGCRWDGFPLGYPLGPLLTRP